MSVLLDTNIVIRVLQASHVDAKSAVEAIRKLRESKQELLIVPQNLYEFWVVATRPKQQNGLGMNVIDAASLQQMCVDQFRLLRDERGIYDRWSEIVQESQTIGKNAHDARLVAAMLKHSIPSLLTFNTQDFQRFSKIRTYSPADILAGKFTA